MPVYVRGMVIPDVALTHRAYQKLMLDLEELVILERRLAVESGAPLRSQATITMRALADTRNSYRDFNYRLRKSAVDGSLRALKGMEERLQAHRVRPPAGGSPTLASLLKANPLPPVSGYETGAVGVADVAELNKAVNRHSRGYGTFWRAIEYGTGQHGVPSQVGRVIYGSFMSAGGGDASAPDPGQSGVHPIFVSGYRPGFGQRVSGLGTIGKEIEGRHFIQFGADQASVQWRQEIMAMQQRAVDQLAAIRLRS